MEGENKNNICYRLTAFTPIACVPQAHVAVVLCKHNPTDRKYIFINLSPFIIPYKRVTPLKPL